MSNPTSQPAPPPVDAITVKVDGVPVTVPRTMPDPLTGRPLPTTMIQACEMAGVTVPHYCYHPKLPVAGNCRMCLVEFGLPILGPDRRPVLNPDGTPRIAVQMLPYEPSTPRAAIACATPISPGMEIYTKTPGVLRVREAVLESLLINHPLDCPICDQAGECKLQEYALDHGPSGSRFVETKVHKPKQVDLGPRIMLDDERCILCSRCIRFTRDVVGDDALGIVDRGGYSTLTHYPGRPFDNNYTLNTVDLCPVGALTSKDFRFQMRVWFLKETRSLCTSCATGCNIIISSRQDRVYRYEPRQNDAVNSCWMCDAGRLNYKWIHRPDRLTEPHGPPVHHAEPFETEPWTATVQQVIEHLRSAPRGSVAVIASSRQTNEELFLLGKLASHFDALTDSVPRHGQGDTFLVHADKNPNSTGSRLFGIAASEPGLNLPRIREAIRQGQVRTLLVFGEDVTRHGLDSELLRRLDALIVSDILPNDTTALAHYLLPGCAHAEKRGTFINARGRIQRFLKAIEPPGKARPECEFLAELVKGVTGTEIPENPVMLWEIMASERPELRGLSWAALGDLGAELRR
jgi:NADH-quinone oxidoreductase subunit G